MQLRWDCSPWMSASTKTVRTSLESGNPSTELLAMARMRVVFPESFPPSRPYFLPRSRRILVLWRRILVPYASVNLQLQSSSASSSSSSSGTSIMPSAATRHFSMDASAVAAS